MTRESLITSLHQLSLYFILCFLQYHFTSQSSFPGSSSSLRAFDTGICPWAQAQTQPSGKQLDKLGHWVSWEKWGSEKGVPGAKRLTLPSCHTLQHLGAENKGWARQDSSPLLHLPGTPPPESNCLVHSLPGLRGLFWIRRHHLPL